MFGITPEATTNLWHLGDRLFYETQQHHLSWALLFLRVYAADSVNEVITGASRKTFREHYWKVLEALADVW